MRFLSSTFPEKTPKLLRKIAKDKLVHKALVLNFTALNCPALEKVQYQKKLQDVRSVKVWNKFFPADERQGFDDEQESFFFLRNLCIFTNLKSLTVEFQFGHYKPETFYDVFEILSEAKPDLTSLEIKMSFSEVKEGEIRNLKKIIAKFTQLKYLRLNLAFDQSLSTSGRIFSSIASLKNLKYLNIDIDWKHPFTMFDHSEIIKFISAQKKLETLKLNFYKFLFNEYVEIFGAVQKMKSLTSLHVVTQQMDTYTFEYGIVFKALEALKKLQSFKLELGYVSFYPKFFRDIFKSLLKHPSLEKANLALPMASKADYCFDDELYANIKKLKEKLRSFKVTLPRYGDIYAEFREEISKIIIPDGISNKNFAFSFGRY